MKSVVICGSTRFKPEMRKFAAELKKAGVVVYEPFLHQGRDEWKKMSEDYKDKVALGLTHDHFYKIRRAEVVFVYNKGGYVGNSTTLEMGFAVAEGRPIYALSLEDEERCRRVLIKEVVKTPKELISKLK